MRRHQTTDQEYLEFWAGVDAAAEEVAKWPEWKIDRVQAAQFAKSARDNRASTDERK
jgi:hypothetical protein